MSKFYRHFWLIVLLLCTSALYAQPRSFNINDANTDLNSLQRASSTINLPKNILTEGAEQVRVMTFSQNLRTLKPYNVGDTLLLDLFASKSYKAVIKEVYTDVNNVISITAVIPEYKYSSCFMAISNAGTSMTISIPELNEQYFSNKIKSTTQTYLVQQSMTKVQSKIPEGAPSVIAPEIKMPEDKGSIQKAIRSSSLVQAASVPTCAQNNINTPATVDVLIVYTPAAETYFNANETSVANALTNTINNSNLSMINSQTSITFRLAHSAKINYTEVDPNTDLARLRNSTDGHFDEIHTLRQTHNADIVILLGDMSGSGFAGLGYMLNHTYGRKDLGFCLVDPRYASWGYTLVHEIGHNMGCDHHNGQLSYPGPGVYPYSSGWRWADGASMYCTVMTYTGGSNFPDGKYAQRVAHFSSPNVNYNGIRTGVDTANNALTLKQTKHFIANYSGQSLPIAVSNSSKKYGEPDPDFYYRTNYNPYDAGPSQTLLPTDKVEITREPGEAVGTYPIKSVKIIRNGTQDVTCEYNMVLIYNNVNFNITKNNVNVSANNVTKEYGDTDPVFTFTNNASLTATDFTGTLARNTGENLGTYTITKGDLTVKDTSYQVNFVNNGAKLTIKSKKVTVFAHSVSKVYGDADSLTFGNDAGLSPSDFIGALTRVSGENVGQYHITQGTLAVKNPNYTLVFSDLSSNLTILSKDVIITPDSIRKAVGAATDPVITFTNDAGLNPSDFTGALERSPGETVGTYLITIGTLSADSNYNLIMTSDNSKNLFHITQKLVKLQIYNKSKEHGAIDPTFTYHLFPESELVDGDVINISRQPGESLGTYPIDIVAIERNSTIITNEYLVVIVGTAELEIFPKTVIITADFVGKEYGDTDPELTYSNNAGLSQSDFTGKLSRTPGENIGSYAIILGTLNAPNCSLILANNGAKLTILQKTVTITPVSKTITYGDTEPTLTFTNDAGLAPADFTGKLDRADNTNKNVGEYAINIGTLATASSVYRLKLDNNNPKLTITPKEITITADDKTISFRDPEPVLTFTNNGSLSLSDFTGKLGREPGYNVGVYAINLGNLSAGTNYTLKFADTNPKLNIVPKVVTITADSKTKQYNDPNPTLTFSNNAGLSLNDFTGELSRTIGENIETYPINIGTLSAGTNYELQFDNNGAALKIEQKTVIITANNASKLFGQADPELTFTNDANLSASDFSGKLGRTTGEDVGTYPINIGTLTAGANYILKFANNNAALTIAYEVVTITATSATKVYDNVDPVFTFTNDKGFKLSDFDGKLGREAGENVGTYKLTIGTLNKTGYVLKLADNNAKLTITPKEITVTANSVSKTYNEIDPELTFTNNAGLSLSDFTGVLDRAIGENVGTYAINKGTLSAGQNYTITFADNGAKLTIVAKEIIVTVNNVSKEYGENDPVFTFTTTISVAEYSGILSRAEGENAGSYLINLGTLKPNNSNYVFKLGNIASLTISRKSVLITPNSATKAYGSNDPVLTFSNNADLNLSAFAGKLGRAAGENKGEYPLNIGTLSLGSNYELVFANNSAKLTITAQTIKVKADDKSKKISMSDPELTYTIIEGSLIVPDAFTGAITRDIGETKGIYNITQGTLALSTNYDLIFEEGKLVIYENELIAQEITWNQDFDLTYGDPDVTLNATSNKDLTVSYTSNNTAIATVIGNVLSIKGAGTVTITAIQSGNEEFSAATPVAKTIIIKKRAQVITWNQATRVVLGNSPITLTATVDSNLELTYQSADNTIAEVNENRLVLKKKGSVEVTVEQAGDKNYLPASITKTFVITDCVQETVASAKVCQGTPFTWEGIEFDVTTPGVKQEVKQLVSSNGCDSTVTFTLTVVEAPSISFQQSQTNLCGTSEIVLDYTLTGDASNINVEFDANAREVGFVDAIHPISGILNIQVPNTVNGGEYTITVTPQSIANCNGTPVNLTFSIAYPASLIVQKWHDVLVCNNSSNEFTAYQWYKNGMAILGATKQYYQIKDNDYTAQYHVVVTNKNNKQIPTCAMTPEVNRRSGSETMLYPNPVNAGNSVKIRTGLSIEDLQGAEVTVYSINGQQVSNFKVNSTNIEVPMPSQAGFYLVVLKTQWRTITLKSIVQ